MLPYFSWALWLSESLPICINISNLDYLSSFSSLICFLQLRDLPKCPCWLISCHTIHPTVLSGIFMISRCPDAAFLLNSSLMGLTAIFRSKTHMFLLPPSHFQGHWLGLSLHLLTWPWRPNLSCTRHLLQSLTVSFAGQPKLFSETIDLANHCSSQKPSVSL